MSAVSVGARGVGEIQLSVVVPVYGCADCLVALHERLTATLGAMTDSYELVFIDDRSVDDGWAVLQQLGAQDPHVNAFRLSRNFGQDAAITAGLAQARGDWAVVMDCDLQEAPEDVPRLWAAAQAGYDIVRTTRRGWHHSAFRRRTSRIYRRLTLETDVRPDYSNLSLLSRRVVDAFLRLHDRDREYMIALDWLGFDSTSIEIEHHERHAGTSGYTLRRLVQVALDGMFFRSTVLLRLVVLLGFVIAVIGVVVAGFEVVDYFAEPHKTVPGYTSLAVLLLVLAGFIIVSVGVVGLYVGRIFEQVKNRPLFLIDDQTGGSAADSTNTRSRPPGIANDLTTRPR
jgi:dolichol-phosphate mannosyltransferase